jgi:pyruvate/2-oxoglutarate dehydrogenase complex dihydrolipoamide acyltransferase (E2) component
MSNRLNRIPVRHAWRRIAMADWGEPNDPTVYGTLEVDCTVALDYIADLRERQAVKVTITHLVGRAVALAIASQPQVNCRISLGRLLQRDTVDIFFQVSSEGGADLSGAKVNRVSDISAIELAQTLNERAERIRQRNDPQFETARRLMKILPGPALTVLLKVSSAVVNHLDVGIPSMGLPRDPFGSAMVTNVGGFALETGFAPLVPMSKVPLILLVGQVRKRAVVVDDRVVARPMITLCATFDHRLMDGYQAGKLAQTVRAYLADPAAHEPPLA